MRGAAVPRLYFCTRCAAGTSRASNWSQGNARFNFARRIASLTSRNEVSSCLGRVKSPPNTHIWSASQRELAIPNGSSKCVSTYDTRQTDRNNKEIGTSAPIKYPICVVRYQRRRGGRPFTNGQELTMRSFVGCLPLSLEG